MIEKLIYFFILEDGHSLNEKRLSVTKETNINEILSTTAMTRTLSAKKNEPPPKTTTTVNSPNKTIGFKFNKSKKDSANNENNVTGVSAAAPPRKKFEKLNYKNGVDILEAYKERVALLKSDKNRVNLENNAKIVNTAELTSLSRFYFKLIFLALAIRWETLLCIFSCETYFN